MYRLSSRLALISTELPPAPAVGPWPTEVLLFTQMPVEEALRMQGESWQRMLESAADAQGETDAEGAADVPGHQLLLMEHPPTYLIGERADPGRFTLSDA